MNGLTEFIKTLGPARVAAMGAVAAILIGVFAFIWVFVAIHQSGRLQKAD